MAPIFQAVGAQQNSTGASVSVAWPTHLTDDIGLVVIETSGNSANLTPPAGWAAIPSTPVTDVATTAGSKLHVWWKRAASSAEAAVATGAATDHIVARLFTFRGCVTTGNPWDVTTTGTKTTASTTATVPALTTTVADTLIVGIVGRPNDNASTTHFGTLVNSNLANIGAAGEAGTTSGNGGGFAVEFGDFAGPGNTGTSTLTKIASTTDTYVVLALKAPVVNELICNTGTFNDAGVNINLIKSSTIHGTTQTYSIVGNDVDLSKSVSLDIDTGTFTLNGTTTGLLFNRNLIQQLGTFSLAGNNAILLKSSILDTSVGTYSLVGNLLDPNIQRAIVGTTGSFLLDGKNALLQRAARIDATTRTYAVAGTTTGLLQNRQLVSQTGTFSIAGVDVVLQYNSSGIAFTLDTIVGAYSLAGTTLTLNKQFELNTQTGSYSLSGKTLGFIQALALHSVPGSFSVSGKDAVFSLTRSFNLTTGTYNVSGNNADVTRFYQLNNQPGTYQVVGSGLDYFSDRNLVALPLDIVADFKSIGNFFWYQTTQTIQPVKYKITKRNEWILGRATHMGRRGL
jgi:hypothetical protein